MSLLDTLRSGIKIADNVTKPLQGIVTYQRSVTTADGYNEPSYPTSAPLHAIIDMTSVPVRNMSGIVVMAKATLTLLNVAEVAAATGGLGIGANDVFILPNGTTGPILNTGGFVDAGTGNPVATEVYLG